MKKNFMDVIEKKIKILLTKKNNFFQNLTLYLVMHPKENILLFCSKNKKIF